MKPESMNPHAQRLYRSLLARVGEADAQEFAEALPLSKSADDARKFRWAKDACAWLEGKYCARDTGHPRRLRLRALGRHA